MAALVAAIHFPEAEQGSFGLWKMDGRDKPGHDDDVRMKETFTPHLQAMRSCIIARRIFAVSGEHP